MEEVHEAVEELSEIDLNSIGGIEKQYNIPAVEVYKKEPLYQSNEHTHHRSHL